MKKIFYFIVPVVIIVIAASYFTGKSSTVEPSGSNTSSNCLMTPQQYLEADKTEVVILDVRTQREYDYGHLEGAVVIDIYQRDFRDKVNKLDKNKTYYVYCKTGIRSRNAVNFMRQSGFKNVCDLQGGVNYLARAGVQFVR